jgi:hypothetical protein
MAENGWNQCCTAKMRTVDQKARIMFEKSPETQQWLKTCVNARNECWGV